MLGVLESELAVVCNWCNNYQQCWDLQCIMGRIQHTRLAVPKETICNARAWPQHCWKSCANGSKIVATKKILSMRDVQLAQKFDRFQTLRNNSLQHATGRGTYTTLLGVVSSGGFRGGARGAPPPLIFRPNWGPKGRKKLFGWPPPPYFGVWMTVPPPPPAYLKVWIRHWLADNDACVCTGLYTVNCRL